MDRPQKYLFDVPTGREIAEAVSEIILAVKTDTGVTSTQLGALFGDVSEDTVNRLIDRKTDKVPASVIAVIGSKFGGEYVQPYMALFGHKAVPLHCEEAVNALPAITALSAKLAAALTNGRAELDHQALSGMLHELREVDGVISKLRARAAELGMIA